MEKVAKQKGERAGQRGPTRMCRDCEEPYPETDEYFYKMYGGKLDPACKKCRLKKQKERRQEKTNQPDPSAPPENDRQESDPESGVPEEVLVERHDRAPRELGLDACGPAEEEPGPFLARQHWGYVDELLAMHGIGAEDRSMIGFHYRSAFVHGFKHGVNNEAT